MQQVIRGVKPNLGLYSLNKYITLTIFKKKEKEVVVIAHEVNFKCDRCGKTVEEISARKTREFCKTTTQVIGSKYGPKHSKMYCKRCRKLHSLVDERVKEFDDFQNSLKAEEILAPKREIEGLGHIDSR